MGKAPFRTLAALLLINSFTAAQSQTPPPPDPLLELFSEDRPQALAVRLHIALLRVPMHTAAEALAFDTGEAEGFWRSRLTEWRKAGHLELVTHCQTDANDGFESSPRRAREHHFVYQAAASHFWFRHQLAKEDNEPLPDFNDLLQELDTDETGTTFKATLNMQRGWRQARLAIKFLHAPEPDARANPLWTVPYFSAPRFLFRPWQLETTACVPVQEPFLLGAQMEPPRDGENHTGHLLMAFGRLVLPDQSDLPDLSQSVIEPALHLQFWTLAVDRQIFEPWIAARRSFDQDGKTLSAWLKMAATRESAELLGAAALAIGEDADANQVTSTLRWRDAAGFEPGGTRTEYRPLAHYDRECLLQHGLELSLRNVSELSDPFIVADPNQPPPPKGDRWGLNLFLSRPSAAAVWKKFPYAMEQSANDPRVLELAEADIGEPGEYLRTQMVLAAGRTTLAGAAPKQDRVHVTFVRLIQAQAAKLPAGERAPPESGTTTFWTIETSAPSWQNRLLGPERQDFALLAQELLAAGPNSARVISVSSVNQPRGNSGGLAATEPKVFLGGSINTAVAPKGIFFNMEGLDFVRTGESLDAGFDHPERHGEGMLEYTLSAIGPPEWRHWGVWQPHLLDEAQHHRLPGIDQPVFPTLRLEQRVRQDLSQPLVVAVVRPFQTQKLRWVIARRDGDPVAAPTPIASGGFAAYIDDPRTLQAIVIGKTPAGDLDPAQLLEQARQGAVPVLDLVTLRISGSRKATFHTGSDFYFPNGRDRLPNQKEPTPIKDTATMPPATRFASQFPLDHRIVGFQFHVEGGEWRITRDNQPPKVITDTFSNVRLEWPWLTDHEKSPPTTVNVQRPIFSVQEAQGDIPAIGQATLTRLTPDTALILRTLN